MKKNRCVIAAALLILLWAGAGGQEPKVQASSVKVSPDAGPGSLMVDPNHGKMPLSFIPNQGEADARLGFYLQGKEYPIGHGQDESPELLQYTAGGHVLGFRKGEMLVASGDHVLRVEFVNGRPVSPEGEARSRNAQSSGTEAPPFGKVSYGDLWDGVTLVYEEHGSGVVKSTYHIEAGAATAVDRVDEIRLRYNVTVRVDAGGSLVFSFATGELRESPPVAWQEIEGKRVPMEVSYRLRGEQEVGFEAGSFDPRYPLVIDPVLSWNTFLGGASDDYCGGIALDAGGNIYVAGHSGATWGTPVHRFYGGANAFAAKLDGNGALLWNAFSEQRRRS